MTVSIEAKHHFVYDGAVVNIYHANTGEGLPKHSHAYAHATICMNGKCIIRKADKEFIIDKDSQPLNLLAGSWHEIEALEDGTVFVNLYSESKM